MSVDEKPFACYTEGCGMRFTNEDHLAVHRKKHEMCLTLSGAGNNKSAIILDQTPTPTRFIRNCEEVGLFQDLQNVNPFDEQFRKAVQSNSSTTLSTLSVPSEENDSLNTPSVYPVSLQPDDTTTISSTVPSKENKQSEDTVEDSSGGITIPTISVSSSKNVESSADTDCVEIIPIPTSNSASLVTNLDSKICDTAVSSSNVITTSQLISSTKKISSRGTSAITENITVQKPLLAVPAPAPDSSIVPPIVLHIPEASAINTQQVLITNQSSVLKDAQIANVNQVNTVQDATKLTNTYIIGQSQESALKSILPRTIAAKNDSNTIKVVHSQQNANKVTSQLTDKTMNVQVLIKLQDGSTYIPALQTAAVNPCSSSNEPNSIPTNAKQKLKQALAQNQTPAKHTKSIPVPSAVETTATDVIISEEEINTSKKISQGSSNNKKRRRSSDDDPAEKRQKFLERNRAAATRCRLRRKTWIDALENKAQLLDKRNMELQNEVNSLKNEVSDLKTMLLAHKDCPITQQQIQQQNQNNVIQSNAIQSSSNSSSSSADDAAQLKKVYLIVQPKSHSDVKEVNSPEIMEVAYSESSTVNSS